MDNINSRGAVIIPIIMASLRIYLSSVHTQRVEYKRVSKWECIDSEQLEVPTFCCLSSL